MIELIEFIVIGVASIGALLVDIERCKRQGKPAWVWYEVKKEGIRNAINT